MKIAAYLSFILFFIPPFFPFFLMSPSFLPANICRLLNMCQTLFEALGGSDKRYHALITVQQWGGAPGKQTLSCDQGSDRDMLRLPWELREGTPNTSLEMKRKLAGIWNS